MKDQVYTIPGVTGPCKANLKEFHSEPTQPVDGCDRGIPNWLDTTERDEAKEMEQGVKYDEAKPQYSLTPPDALHEVVKVLTFGAQKYTQKGIDWSAINISEVSKTWNANTVARVMLFSSSLQASADHAPKEGGLKISHPVDTVIKGEKYTLQELWNAGLVTTRDSKKRTQNTPEDNTKTQESGPLRTETEWHSTSVTDLIALIKDSVIETVSGKGVSVSSAYHNEIMTVFLKMDAKSAAERTANRILTTAIKPAGSGACFAVGATTVSGCWEMTYRVLKELCLISSPLKEKVLSEGRDNWKRVPDLQRRYLDALQRHLYAYQKGETHDPESGYHHLAHAGCCLMFMLQDNIDELGGVK